jgi:hypothetical protein
MSLGLQLTCEIPEIFILMGNPRIESSNFRNGGGCGTKLRDVDKKEWKTDRGRWQKLTVSQGQLNSYRKLMRKQRASW